jgi:hypothetical protein
LPGNTSYRKFFSHARPVRFGVPHDAVVGGFSCESASVQAVCPIHFKFNLVRQLSFTPAFVAGIVGFGAQLAVDLALLAPRLVVRPLVCDQCIFTRDAGKAQTLFFGALFRAVCQALLAFESKQAVSFKTSAPVVDGVSQVKSRSSGHSY